MTQLPHDYTQTCDELLRLGQEYLAQGELALASAKGWDAAGYAAKTYAGLIWQSGSDADFKDVVLQLSKDHRSHDSSVEWAVSAMALADNARYDWLDKSGVGRRFDDVQRLAMLVFDIANPPQDAEAILRRAWVCLANGALAVAAEKGWDAVTYAAKTYAEAMGYDYIRGDYLDQVTPLLMKEPGGSKVGVWSLRALNLLENTDPRRNWLDADLVSEDLNVSGKFITLVKELTPQKHTS